MENILFGIDTERVTSFEEFKTDTGTDKEKNVNPYGKKYFDKPAQMATVGNYQITSIPSPYARMHITDIAFREANTGRGVMRDEAVKNKVLSDDYRRAMSHCLDVYEMLFRFNELDLIDNNITVQLVNLASTNSTEYNDVFKKHAHLKNYIQTLELFRRAYVSVINGRGYDKYKFDFTSLYIFKYNGKTFASTSPFTGFYAKADANVVKIENGEEKPVLVVSTTKGKHNLFTSNSADYQDITERSEEFQKFMYLLLKDGLNKVFPNLFDAVMYCFDDKGAKLKNLSFEKEYPMFNFGNDKLPKIYTTSGKEVYIRPANLDTSYLKYLLYLEHPAFLDLDEENYNKDISDRVFPIGSQNKMPWLCINDILTDSLVVLPYDINKNYQAIDYIDENNNKHRRCLIPVKRKALDYLRLDDLIGNLKVKKYDDNHYAVTLTVKLETGGETKLRRDYYSIKSELNTFPNGCLITGNDMCNFAFGIYPFVKSLRFDNIYKVLFYNSFKKSVSNDYSFENYNLKFFYYNEDGKALEYNSRSVVTNQTNSSDDVDFPVNCHYYEVNDSSIVNNKKIYIEFAELDMTIKVKAGNEKPEKTYTVTSIIAPSLRSVDEVPGWTRIAIDLGTSNTFIAYNHEGVESNNALVNHTIKTMHGDWNELTFMNDTCSKSDEPNAIEENRDDLYLKCDGEKPSSKCLSAQLSEFIPSRIVEKDDYQNVGYKFPIPSVINNHRIDCKKVGNKLPKDQLPISLVHSCIPFAYYSLGKRKNSKYDEFSKESFKWFYGDEKGYYDTDDKKKAEFCAFLEELMFITRSHMLCNGYDLEECRLLWTYPISFSKQLYDKYKEEWEKIYCKFFNPKFINGKGMIERQGNNENIDEYVISTNESRTPIFDCMDNPAYANKFTVLMDIGGGTTDIIGYKRQDDQQFTSPMFITSFNFAGNALYLDSNINHKNIQKNIIRQYVIGSCKDVFNEESELQDMVKIKSDESISSLMNYGFSQHESIFNSMFANDDVQFMLQIHNAALIYHTAELCKYCCPNEKPMKIYFSGNGSKMLKLNNRIKQIVEETFNHFYSNEKNGYIGIEPSPDPKAATAIGSLKGYESGGLETNENAKSKRVVMLGDDKTCYELTQYDYDFKIPNYSSERENLCKKIEKNVEDFIDLFYAQFVGNHVPLSKTEMMDCFQLSLGDSKLDLKQIVDNTLFFNHIALLMEQVSYKIYDKKNLDRIK